MRVLMSASFVYRIFARRSRPDVGIIRNVPSSIPTTTRKPWMTGRTRKSAGPISAAAVGKRFPRHTGHHFRSVDEVARFGYVNVVRRKPCACTVSGGRSSTNLRVACAICPCVVRSSVCDSKRSPSRRKTIVCRVRFLSTVFPSYSNDYVPAKRYMLKNTY